MEYSDLVSGITSKLVQTLSFIQPIIESVIMYYLQSISFLSISFNFTLNYGSI